MRTYKILLSKITDVQEFVNTVNKYSFDIDLRSGKYLVDAKSIMGIFSLDLSKEIEMSIEVEDETLVKEFEVSIEKFLIR